MFMDHTVNTVRQAAREVIKEYGLDWSLDSDDVVEDGADICLLTFKFKGGKAGLSFSMQDVIQKAGKVTKEGVAQELRKGLEKLGHSRT